MSRRTPPYSRSPLLLPLSVSLAAVLAGPGCSTAESNADGDDAEDSEADTVARLASGTIAGTDIFVATVYEEGNAIAYFCGGDTTFETHTRWFAGPPTEAGAFEHSVEGWRVTGDADGDGVTGTLMLPDGTEHEYTTRDASESSLAGLYSAEVDGCRAGVIVVEGDGEPQAQGTYFCEGDDALFVQVIILAPVALSPGGGIDVSVPLPDGEVMLTVEPV